MSTTRAPENDVRSATVAAATRLFAAHGFDGTALQSIADAVGVSKPAVLHHYPSKEHIRQAVLGRILEHWTRILPRLLVAASATDDRFDAVFGELVRFFAADPDLARIMVREALDRPGELHTMLSRTVRPWLGAVADYVNSGRDGGRHHADVDAEAYVLHTMQLVVNAIACGPATSPLLERDAGARYARELARIARSSLFSEPRPEATASSVRVRRQPPRKRKQTR
jgi:TetR/AcrR family transcriptional regulator